MKHLKTFEDRQDTSIGTFSSNLIPGERFLTDEEIEEDYNEWKIEEEQFEWSESQSSGWIIMSRPYDETCDECETEKSDNFIIYDDGKIAFDNWYPSELGNKMKMFIYEQMDENHPLKNKVKEFIMSSNESKINEKTKAKYKKGDKVNYVPKLSGHNPKKKLEIDYVEWRDKDDLDDLLGVKSKPTWLYGFKKSNLQAIEKDIKLVKESKLNENKTKNTALSNDVSTELNREMKKIWNYAKFTDHQLPRGIITPGKFLDLGETKGYINRIEGDIIFLETIDGTNEMKEVSFADVAKKYKIKNVKEEVYEKPELKTGKAIGNPADKGKGIKDQKTEKVTKKIYKFKDMKLKNKLGGPKVNESSNSDLVDKYMKDLDKMKKTISSCKTEKQTRNADKMVKLFKTKWVKSKVAHHGLQDDIDKLVDSITKKLSKFKD